MKEIDQSILELEISLASEREKIDDLINEISNLNFSEDRLNTPASCVRKKFCKFLLILIFKLCLMS